MVVGVPRCIFISLEVYGEVEFLLIFLVSFGGFLGVLVDFDVSFGWYVLGVVVGCLVAGFCPGISSWIVI